MACAHPMVASVTHLAHTGKTKVSFLGKATTFQGKYRPNLKLLPCRQCLPCRLERSRQWAVRLMHEAKFHENAVFLTLTYDDENLPKTASGNPTLNSSHLTTFFRDFRARIAYHYAHDEKKSKIKYFACGEYGEKNLRPHYHLALFGGPLTVCQFSKDTLRTEAPPTRGGDPQFNHSDVSACWGHGLHRFSELNFDTAAYIARYITKKVTGAAAESFYGDREPDFQRSSNGLGRGHLEKWLTDVYPSDQVVLQDGRVVRPPPYYDRRLEKTDPFLFEEVKRNRETSHEPLTREQWLEKNFESLRELEYHQALWAQRKRDL